MFVWSLKAPRKRLVLWAILLAVLIGIVGAVVYNKSHTKDIAQCENGKYELKAQNNSERVQFLSQFGWHVQAEPLAVTEVTIPSVFNDTYEKYNEIQKQQGLDLSHYKEKNCHKFSYTVLNYPKRGHGVIANVLVLDNKVIGGDISSVELDGFCHGFVMPKPSEIEQTVQTCTEARTTQRQTLSPDPAMPAAPVD